jgi:quercetin dioxygenase-like cupin family protein
MAGMAKVPLAMLVLGLVVGAAATQLVQAQQSGIRRTLLQQQELTDIPGHVALIGTVEIPAGGSAGRHAHPGTEIGYVLEGSGTLLIDGQPPRAIRPGDSWIIPAGTPHYGRAGEVGPVKVLGVFVVEKGKPLATPAP